MLTEIQDAVINALKTPGRQVEAHDATGIDPTLVKCWPAIMVAIDKAEFERSSRTVYHAEVTIDVLVAFKAVRGETARRDGIYPLIVGVIQRLAGSKLGLDITALQPLGIHNVTNAEFAEAGMILFRVSFSTGFDLRLDLDGCAAAPDLLAVGLNYFLQEPVDDGKADASDVLNIPH